MRGIPDSSFSMEIKKCEQSGCLSPTSSMCLTICCLGPSPFISGFILPLPHEGSSQSEMALSVRLQVVTPAQGPMWDKLRAGSLLPGTWCSPGLRTWSGQFLTLARASPLAARCLFPRLPGCLVQMASTVTWCPTLQQQHQLPGGTFIVMQIREWMWAGDSPPDPLTLLH